MTKIGRPTRLIGYDNDINVQRRIAGKKEIFKPIRARTVVYVVLIVVVCSVMLYALLTRSLLDVNVLHDRNPGRGQAQRRFDPQRLYAAFPQQARLRPRHCRRYRRPGQCADPYRRRRFRHRRTGR